MPLRQLAATADVNGEALRLASHLSAASPARLLTQPLTYLRERSAASLGALDAVISGV